MSLALAAAAVIAAVAAVCAAKTASLFIPITLVCEWKPGSAIGQPLNLLASSAFFITAGLLWRDYRRTRKDLDVERLTLIALLVLIGISSAAFHIEANRLTLYADAAAVSLFIPFATYITVRRVLDLTVNRTLVWVAGIGAMVVLANAITLPSHWNGTAGFIPVVGGLALLAWHLRRRNDSRSAAGFGIAAVLLAVGLAFRSIDLATCLSPTIGTYFLWRLCEGLAIYFLVRTIYERHEKSRGEAAHG